MSAISANKDTHDHDEHNSHHDHHEKEMQDQQDMKIFGFWVYLMTDVILFATVFVTFIVLRGNLNGGHSGKELFSMTSVMIETFILLTSSFTCGLAVIRMNEGNQKSMRKFLWITVVLGLAFLSIEIDEFRTMVAEGEDWTKSGFLAGFFTLVGMHGLHVLTGLIWMVGLIFQTCRRGLTMVTKRKVMVVSLFWHFLDIIWIFVFSIVYLMGVM